MTTLKRRKRHNNRGSRYLLLGLAVMVWLLVWFSVAPPSSDSMPLITALQHKPPRFLTLVLFSPVNEKERWKRLEGIADTWGPEANAIFVVRNESDYPRGGAQVMHLDRPTMDTTSFPKLHLLPSNQTTKPHISLLQFAIQAAHTILLADTTMDYVMLASDHTFVLPDKVCGFLRNHEPTQPLHAGHALLAQKQHPFNSGPTGIVFSRYTVQQLVESFQTGGPESCVGTSDKIAQWLKENPELLLAQCLVQELKTPMVDTRDASSRHRFHSFGIIRTLLGEQDEWYKNYHKDPNNLLKMGANYSILQTGRQSCSPETVSFHYVQEQEARALYEIRRQLLEQPTMSDPDLKLVIKSK